jgi:hypothetical protein
MAKIWNLQPGQLVRYLRNKCNKKMIKEEKYLKCQPDAAVEINVALLPAGCLAIAHLADHVPCGWEATTFLIARFIHSRLVLWNKHHQAHHVAERNSRIHSNGPIQRTKTHSPSWST